ncbi:MAG: ABC transporter ATP-binding protein [Anaerolineae bacterium]|nr:ABC transporter ATP-binding protein [Anaerolineae bacterium]
MIVIENVKKIYADGTTALLDINLSIPPGIFGLLGPNGAGKTTLMRILATLIAPTSGTVSVAGFSVQTHAHEIRKIIGYLPQNYQLHPQLTAWEFLDYLGILSGMTAGRKSRIEEVLLQVGLQPHAHKKIRGLSGGMKQRIAIAQALLHNPKILIVDEPTAGLDPAERNRFRNLLAQFSIDRLVLLSTHIVADISSTCRSLTILDKGGICFTGSVADASSLAEHHVWEATLPLDKLEHFQGELIITSMIKSEDSNDVKVRYIDVMNSALVESSVSVPSTLEDSYLYAISNRKAS